MDTAIDPWLGNLLEGDSFAHAVHLAQGRAFALGLTGPPCETWTAARHIVCDELHGKRTSTIALQFTCMGPPWPIDARVMPTWCRFESHAAQLIVGSPDLSGRWRQYHGASRIA